MNPSQRRGLALLSLSIIGAVVVFAAVLSYVGDIRAQVGPTRQVLMLRHGVAAQQVVTVDDFESVAIPDRWISSAMVLADDQRDLAGQIARLDQPAGAMVQQGMFGPKPRLGAGQVEISASIGVESALGGRVRPGDVVHVSAAYVDVNGREHVRRIIEGALVLQVGDAGIGDDTEPSFDDADIVPITFALDTEAANCLTFAENFAENLLLARPGEFATVKGGQHDCPASWNTGYPPTDAGPDADAAFFTEPADDVKGQNQ